MEKDGTRAGRHGWIRWLDLARVVTDLWLIWDRLKEYTVIKNAGIYSPERLAEELASRRFSLVSSALSALTFAYVFFTWNWDRETASRQRLDSIALSVATLLWALIFCLIPLAGLDLFFWALILLIVAGGAVYSWWKYWRQMQKNTKSQEED